jgi:hypothetical protein
MAAAGAKAGETKAAETPAPADGAAYTMVRLGVRPRRGRRSVAIAAVGLLAVGGVALGSVIRLGGHAGRAGADRSRAPATRQAAPAPSAPARARAVPVPSAPARTPFASPAARGRGPAASLEVAGVGCPGDGDDVVTVNNAPTGPGWMPAGGGWTGNGCDGSTLWTMDPNGNQPAPSTLTWRFSPAAGAARCTLSVFVPTQNALGVSDYSVSTGPAATPRIVAAFGISQAHEAGQWLTLGTFPVSGSPLEITTAPLPGASGPGHHGAIAASAASARCA